MYCRYCGENNPEEAVFCKNCGKKLKEEPEKIIIEKPVQNTSQSTSTSTSSSNNDSDWIGCCLCLIGIFIIFAILGSF